MFIVIPTAIFFASLVSIIWLVGRKFVYLKKLSPEIVDETAATNGNQNFWAEFFPGLAAKLEKSKWQKYKLAFLTEFEKFLRKLRLVFLKIDTLTNKLIQKIRQALLHHEKATSEKLNTGSVMVQGDIQVRPDIISVPDKTKILREEEHQLIIEIAKNPRDAELYKELGKICVRLGEISDAVESFTKALELDPEDDEIRGKLERVKKRLEKKSVGVMK